LQSFFNARFSKEIFVTNHRLATILLGFSTCLEDRRDIVPILYPDGEIIPVFFSLMQHCDIDTQDRMLDSRKLDRCTRARFEIQIDVAASKSPGTATNTFISNIVSLFAPFFFFFFYFFLFFLFWPSVDFVRQRPMEIVLWLQYNIMLILTNRFLDLSILISSSDANLLGFGRFRCHLEGNSRVSVRFYSCVLQDDRVRHCIEHSCT